MKNLILLSVLFVSFFSNAQTEVYEALVTNFTANGTNYVHVFADRSIDLINARDAYCYPAGATDQDLRLEVDSDGSTRIFIEEGTSTDFTQRNYIPYELTGNMISTILSQPSVWNQLNRVYPVGGSELPNLDLVTCEQEESLAWRDDNNDAIWTNVSHPTYAVYINPNPGSSGNPNAEGRITPVLFHSFDGTRASYSVANRIFVEGQYLGFANIADMWPHVDAAILLHSLGQ